VTNRNRPFRAFLLGGAAAIATVIGAGAAYAAEASFAIEPQPLDSALREFGVQSGVTILADAELTLSKVSPGVRATTDPELALRQVLAGTGLSYKRQGDVFVVARFGEGGSGPQDESAAGGGAEVEALVVTAQKREENIQDVPIAISAFSQKALEEQKIEGGYDLMKAIPNVTFSKSNFSSYNFSIRGVGTKAISATTDPGVAVAFNNTTLIQNRLFEQEYFDIERVEVLRGPQGTLYGRNATSGVINVITRKADLNDFEGSIKGEIGNFDTRRVTGMVNVPIVTDELAVRLAGAWTQRSGYDYNEITGNAVNGRDLWSARLSVGWEPTDTFRANLTWERFEEDDNRSRTGKQLCHRDPGPEMLGTQSVFDDVRPALNPMRQALFSQGCQPGSLYDDNAFGTPNGLALPFVSGLILIGAPCGTGCNPLYSIGRDPVTGTETIIDVADPYGGLMQSRDLRTIASFRDPIYRAKADLLDLTISFDLSDALTLTSQTVYNRDEVYSFQDFNRFNSQPIFNDTSDWVLGIGIPIDPIRPSEWQGLAPRPEGSPDGTPGVFCDPQVGCSDRLAGFDVSQADGSQFSQEFRLQSDFDGPVNFSLGANYTRFQTLIDYYVFYNLITVTALHLPFNSSSDITQCHGTPAGDPLKICPYIDPNPLESINGEGHNYFRSKNPYKLKSSAVFGELYWNINEDLKLTAGLRYTDDTKTFIPVPSQVLLSPGFIGGGTTAIGYPEDPAIEQQWGEFTGRLGLDWKPVLPFTDDTLLYGFYSRGYKGGGANPPSPGFATGAENFLIGQQIGLPLLAEPVLFLAGVEYGRTFEPEFVDAFEVGAKNTLLDGAMTLNMGAFYYDYTDYQVSQIRDRTAVNENFNATIWGFEMETVFSPTRDLRINANLGYLDTKIADGESSIDIMNRTQGNPDYVVVKPWVQVPSNCVLPLHVAAEWARTQSLLFGASGLCAGMGAGHLVGGPGNTPFDPNPEFSGGTGRYDYRNYPELNGGAGLRADLGGNELPNAPHWTMNVGAQYGFDLPSGWRATVRGDGYWQSQSWARVYNAVNDKLHGWYNANLSIWAEHEDWGVKVELYAKNILDDTPITDAFLNSDDTALTTNVFVLDPRVIGLSVRKDF
jgi:iron complex outermembrane receptor protein